MRRNIVDVSFLWIYWFYNMGSFCNRDLLRFKFLVEVRRNVSWDFRIWGLFNVVVYCVFFERYLLVIDLVKMVFFMKGF